MDDAAPAAVTDSGPLSVEQAAGLLGSIREQNAQEQPPKQVEADPVDEVVTDDIGDDVGLEETPITDDAGEGEGDSDTPIIDPPKSWPDEDKEVFRTLPPAVQQRLAQRESKRDADVQRRLNEVAEQRKAVEAERATFEQERQNQISAAAYGLPKMAQEFQAKYGDVDWVALAQEDPAAYIAKRAEHDQALAQLQAAHQQITKAQQDAQTKQEADYRIFVEAEREKLHSAVPDFADPEKGPKLQAEVVKFAKENGYTDDQIAWASARDIQIHLDAMKWRRAQAKRREVQQNKAVPSVQRPGTAPNRGDRKADDLAAGLKRLERSGSVEDAVALMQLKRRT